MFHSIDILVALISNTVWCLLMNIFFHLTMTFGFIFLSLLVIKSKQKRVSCQHKHFGSFVAFMNIYFYILTTFSPRSFRSQAHLCITFHRLRLRVEIFDAEKSVPKPYNRETSSSILRILFSLYIYINIVFFPSSLNNEVKTSLYFKRFVTFEHFVYIIFRFEFLVGENRVNYHQHKAVVWTPNSICLLLVYLHEFLFSKWHRFHTSYFALK